MGKQSARTRGQMRPVEERAELKLAIAEHKGQAEATQIIVNITR